jgi:hypothetical protein
MGFLRFPFSRFWGIGLSFRRIGPAADCEIVIHAKSLKDRLSARYVGVPTDEKKAARFFPAVVDLGDDGIQEIIVYLTSDGWCGTGGCTTLILAPEGPSYKIVTRITVTRLPIRILDAKSNGWHNIGAQVRGWGSQPGYEAELPFDGKTYPRNPSMLPPGELPKMKRVKSSSLTQRRGPHYIDKNKVNLRVPAPD